MVTELQNAYQFCIAMLNAARQSGCVKAVELWDERAHDAYISYGYEIGLFGR